MVDMHYFLLIYLICLIFCKSRRKKIIFFSFLLFIINWINLTSIILIFEFKNAFVIFSFRPFWARFLFRSVVSFKKSLIVIELS